MYERERMREKERERKGDAEKNKDRDKDRDKGRENEREKKKTCKVRDGTIYLKLTVKKSTKQTSNCFVFIHFKPNLPFNTVVTSHP